jgi:hypothetical protein
MSTSKTRKLSTIAAELHQDLKQMGFGTDFPINGADLVEWMSTVYEELDRAVGAALSSSNGVKE